MTDRAGGGGLFLAECDFGERVGLYTLCILLDTVAVRSDCLPDGSTWTAGSSLARLNYLNNLT